VELAAAELVRDRRWRVVGGFSGRDACRDGAAVGSTLVATVAGEARGNNISNNLPMGWGSFANFAVYQACVPVKTKGMRDFNGDVEHVPRSMAIKQTKTLLENTVLANRIY